MESCRWNVNHDRRFFHADEGFHAMPNSWLRNPTTYFHTR
jgi:hypothetical protein